MQDSGHEGDARRTSASAFRRPRRWQRKVAPWLLAALTCAVVAVPSSGHAVPKKKMAAAHKALADAERMAAEGNCEGAIPGYTTAYKVLKDPLILFNRGECHRKVGHANEAVADYKDFLARFPGAPNRAKVEERIAELSGAGPTDAPTGSGATGVAGGAAHAPSIDARTATPATPGGTAAAATPSTATTTPPPPSNAPAKKDVDGPQSPAASDIAVAPAPEDRAPIPAAPTPAPGLAARDMVMAPVPDPDATTTRAEEEGSMLGTWWFWTAVVVAAGAGAAGGWLLLDRRKTDVPDSALGNYRF